MRAAMWVHAAVVGSYMMMAIAPAMGGVLALSRDSILYEQTPAQIAHRRSLCATSDAAKLRGDFRVAGMETLSAGQWCVTVLTRAGRDGQLRYVTLHSGETTSVIAFDTGFVNGYLKREALPASAPTMATLLPIADRCIARTESNLRLCSSAGYILGVRAYHGEIVPVS